MGHYRGTTMRNSISFIISVGLLSSFQAAKAEVITQTITGTEQVLATTPDRAFLCSSPNCNARIINGDTLSRVNSDGTTTVLSTDFGQLSDRSGNITVFTSASGLSGSNQGIAVRDDGTFIDFPVNGDGTLIQTLDGNTIPIFADFVVFGTDGNNLFAGEIAGSPAIYNLSAGVIQVVDGQTPGTSSSGVFFDILQSDAAGINDNGETFFQNVSTGESIVGPTITLGQDVFIDNSFVFEEGDSLIANPNGTSFFGFGDNEGISGTIQSGFDILGATDGLAPLGFAYGIDVNDRTMVGLFDLETAALLSALEFDMEVFDIEFNGTSFIALIGGSLNLVTGFVTADAVSEIPLPAALPLMATALISGGAIGKRRKRRKRRKECRKNQLSV